MTKWQLILSPNTSGAANMAADLALFNNYESGKSDTSTLRIFSWEPKCVSYGYSQKPVKKEGWDAVRRPTGGGIVYHEAGEVSYSIVTSIENPQLPEGLIPSYLAISEILVEALKQLGVRAKIFGSKKRSRDVQSQALLCFAEPAEYEIVSHGQKIVGSAQKRGKRAMLQQGTICLNGFGFAELSGALSRAFGNRLCYNMPDERIESSALLGTTAR